MLPLSTRAKYRTSEPEPLCRGFRLRYRVCQARRFTCEISVIVKGTQEKPSDASKLRQPQSSTLSSAIINVWTRTSFAGHDHKAVSTRLNSTCDWLS